MKENKFYVTITKKINNTIDLNTAKIIIKDLLKWNLVVNDGQSILDSIDIVSKYKYSFWDSMIINAALKSDAKVLLSEDLSCNQIIEGLKIQNPFGD